MVQLIKFKISKKHKIKPHRNIKKELGSLILGLQSYVLS